MASGARPAPGGEEISSIRRWVVVGLIALGMIVAYLDRANLSVALAVESFHRFFGLTDTDRGFLNSAFFWSYALLQIPAGWVVDRYGVKYPYAIALGCWSLLSAATAWVRSLPELVMLRVSLGAAESIVSPASLRWINANLPEERRGLAIGIYAAGTKLGPAVGGPVTAWLIAAYGWRAMFAVLGLGGLLFLIPWLSAVPDDRKRAGAVDAARLPEAPFRRVLAMPAMWGILFGTFCYGYFAYFCITWLPVYFVEERGLSLTAMGIYTMFSFGGLAAMAMLAGWAADRMIARGGDPVQVRRGFTIAGFAVGATELLGICVDSEPWALFFAVFSLAGLGLATSNYWALAQTLAPGSAIGRLTGLQNCCSNLAGIAAPIATGWLKHKTGGYLAPMAAVFVMLLAGMAAFVLVVRPEYARIRPDPAPPSAPA
jgi:MFS transporter, ACS family, D-galactonate transporter